jgi:hypothetical protein
MREIRGPESGEYNFRILTPEQAKRIEEIFYNKILKWHNVHPDFIVVTAASAIAYGIMIKEIWKAIYTSEVPPVFKLIDPRRVEVHSRHIGTGNIPPLNLKGIGSKSRVIIFDEHTTSRVNELIKYHPTSSEMSLGEDQIIDEGDHQTMGITSLFSSAQYLKQAGAGEVWLDSNSENQDEFLHDLAKEHPILERVKPDGAVVGFYEVDIPYQLRRSGSKARQFLADLNLVASRIITRIKKYE